MSFGEFHLLCRDCIGFGDDVVDSEFVYSTSGCNLVAQKLFHPRRKIWIGVIRITKTCFHNQVCHTLTTNRVIWFGFVKRSKTDIITLVDYDGSILALDELAGIVDRHIIKTSTVHRG
uniref:ORF98 n=1 Tax=Malaco herpesvirus 1 TaxID=3031797 RepID=A0AA48P955_9VIRU|nr:TPA_asm: ORF98 [Malaco herpesvirus 1]